MQTLMEIELPVFRLEDFSDVIEVRFTEEMRERLKPHFLTAVDQPYRKIAKRLFTGLAFTPAKCVREIAQHSRIPYEELERSVVSARAGYGGKNCKVTFPGGFPVKPTVDHAWILGLSFSSGGIGNRSGGWIKYPFGRCLRFSVSDLLVEKLVEIGQRIGDVPYVYNPNTRVRTGKPERTRVGNLRRKRAKFHAVTVEILAKFGLPKYSVAVKDKDGWETRGKRRVYSLRNSGLKLPEWIHGNDRFMHAFIEGYINGQKGASWAYSKPYKDYRVIECHAQVRAAGMKKKQTLSFLKEIAEHLKKLNITGKIRPMTYPNSRLTYWIAYEIFRDESLCKLFTEFSI